MDFCNTTHANGNRFLVWALVFGLMLVLGACSEVGDPTDPVTDPPPSDDPIDDPGLTELKAIHLIGPDGMMVPITLLGSELVLQADGTVSIDVAMRNDGFMDLIPPLWLWVGEFEPYSVSIANADSVTDDGEIGGSWIYGFDYSGTMGDDDMLASGQITDVRTWVFTDPDMVAFSFSGWVEGGFGPPPAFISGSVFEDFDFNGERDATEPPLSNVGLRIVRPDGMEEWMHSGPNGEFWFPANDTGLYEVSLDFPPDMPPGSPWVTTANPVYVTLIPGPDGRPLDYDGIEFGVADYQGGFPPPAMPLAFTPLSPGELQMGPWTLVMGEVFDDFMFHAVVEYYGCQPGHHFILYASGDFVTGGDMPRQVITLVDEMDENCDAWFDQDLMFDLWPLKDAYAAAFGFGDLALDFVGGDGTLLATYTVHIDDPNPPAP